MSTKESSNDIAVKYLGRALLLFVLGTFICILAFLNYDAHVSISNKKIEVHTTNSNSINNTID